MENSVPGVSDQNKPQKKPVICVIGDVMVDVDIFCSCERLCQEGPWPVLKVEREERRLGGAGNVAVMCLALGADVMLATCTADGRPMVVRNHMISVCQFEGLASEKRRFWVDSRLQGPRVDVDQSPDARWADGLWIAENIRSAVPDAIIVADHGKGVVTQDFLASAIQPVMNISRIFVDPVATTPFPGFPVDAVVGHDHEIPNWWKAKCEIRKYGANGIKWTGDSAGSLPSECRRLVDPLGAGDQFIAALAYQRCLGTSWDESIRWANVAAGLQCERRGCVPVTVDDVGHVLSDRGELVTT